MGEGNNIDDFVYNLRAFAKKQVPVQTAWVVATSVDWESKTMDAQGVSDELPFQDILLGLGGSYRRPKIGTYCLIGMIENQDAAAVLLDCEEVEEYSLNAGQTVLKSDGESFSIVGQNENLLDVFTLIIEAMQKIIVFQGQNPDYVKLEDALEKVKKILK